MKLIAEQARAVTCCDMLLAWMMAHRCAPAGSSLKPPGAQQGHTPARCSELDLCHAPLTPTPIDPATLNLNLNPLRRMRTCTARPWTSTRGCWMPSPQRCRTCCSRRVQFCPCDRAWCMQRHGCVAAPLPSHHGPVWTHNRACLCPTSLPPQVIVWVLGEYGYLAAANAGPRAMTPQQVWNGGLDPGACD